MNRFSFSSLGLFITAFLGTFLSNVHASPFIFITSHSPKCLEVDGSAGMSLHFHYYSPNLKVGPARGDHRDRWNEMRHQRQDHDHDHPRTPDRFKSGLHNIHENIQRHAKTVTGFHEQSNSPLSHVWQRTVQKMKSAHTIMEEDSASHLRISIQANSIHQHHEVVEKMGTIQFDVHEMASVKFCLLCFTCSKDQPLMVAVDIDEVDIDVVQNVKSKMDSTHKVLQSLHDTHEALRDLKDNPNKAAEAAGQDHPEIQKAKDEFDTHQNYGKTHLSYLKHELAGMMLHLELEMKKSETIKQMENNMFHDGLRFNKRVKFYPTMKILILIIATTMQARSLVAYLKKLHII